MLSFVSVSEEEKSGEMEQIQTKGTQTWGLRDGIM